MSVVFAALGAISLAACSHEDTIEQRRSRALRDESAPGAAAGAGGALPDGVLDAGALDAGALDAGRPLVPVLEDDAGSPDATTPPPASECGDGERTGSEECDDGDLDDRDGCSSACRSEICGNDRVDPGETCDRTHATCVACQTVVATPASCGNRTTEAGETCDDGNSLAGDGCSPACLVERCGDGVVNQAAGVEQCDEPAALGNCDDQCRRVECGNAVKQGQEECDGESDCTDACLSIRCGNGRLDPGEDCETPGAGRCGRDCHAVSVECGDGVQHSSEECDDGNVAHGDGCSPACRLESCGNGRIEAPLETCEPPGNGVCGVRCGPARCGDSFLDALAGEECEDGNIDSGDGCSTSCRIERCGNGRLDPPSEQCDPPGTHCDEACRLRPRGPLELEVPLGGALFQLDNPGFIGSLEPWRLSAVPPAQGSFSVLDVGGSPGSGSLQLSIAPRSTSASPGTTPPPALQGALVRAAQCVRTAPGATYRAAIRAKALEPVAPVGAVLDLAVRFHAGAGCSGAVLGGVTIASAVSGSWDWAALQLPPPSPVLGHQASFVVPQGAGSLELSLELWQEPGLPAAAVAIDGVELVRLSPRLCLNGVPEDGEECEPNVTAGCTNTCRLPALCGDGVEGLGECGDAGDPRACPADCPRPPATCGDGRVAAPEECDPPGSSSSAGVCTATCTLRRRECGNGRLEGAEQCDPPDGFRCNASCRTISCGNGQVEAPEECEPTQAGCTRNCRLKASQPANCGDGLLQGLEQCDPPNLLTWCNARCERQNPKLACGNGRVDSDLGESCDPPSFSGNCGLDCKRPVCGDGKVGGLEQCDPPSPGRCDPTCQLSPLGDADCLACMGNQCGQGAAGENLFAACFALEGEAQAGPAQGTPLRDLCADVVECMRETACAVDTRASGREATPDPASCYCGKGLLAYGVTASETRDKRASLLRACRDGVPAPDGPCRQAFERAAEAMNPTSVLAAMHREFGQPALRAALQLSERCGPEQELVIQGATPRLCKQECAIQSDCGNGVIEAGELCDPALPRGAAGPDPALCDPEHCAILPCGNGVVDTVWPYTPDSEDPALQDFVKPPGWLPETCDIRDPYTSQGEGTCDNACQLEAECGDGKLSAAVEACDPGPSGDWTECCRLGNEPAQLAGCDSDGDGQVTGSEACKIPSRCGDQKRTGLEECDPPEAGKCSDQCRAIGPCAECTAQSCYEQQLCSGAAVAPGFAAACRDTYQCIIDNDCAESPLLACACGSQSSGTCIQLGGDGPCRDRWLADADECLAAGSTPGQCISQFLYTVTKPSGVAGALAKCQQENCFTECFDVAP